MQQLGISKSQPVPGIKIESYILATFLNTMTFSGEIMQKKASQRTARIKGNNNLKRLETNAIAGRMNANYISEALYKLIKG